MFRKNMQRTRLNNALLFNRLISLLLLSIAVMSPIGAVEVKTTEPSTPQETSIQLATPKTLTNRDIKTRDNVIEIMRDKTFISEIMFLARQLDKIQTQSKGIEEQVAISSLLEQNKKTQKLISEARYSHTFYHYKLDSASKLKADQHYSDDILIKQLQRSLKSLSDEDMVQSSSSLGWSLSMGEDYLMTLFNHYKADPKLTIEQALKLVLNVQLYRVYERILPLSVAAFEKEQEERFLIEPNVTIKTKEGITLSAVVVRKRGQTAKQPTAFQFSIYADAKWHIKTAIHAAAHGYVGVIANTRGKRLSKDEIVPWEHDGKDATAVIDWIIKQSWSDEQVVMYGGSYLGFTQWAATKYRHPALKTIVPYCAANPFTGLPVENNIFITPNYQWAFHVTNNKTMDHSVYSDWDHWQKVYDTLFESGRAFKDIDKIEGTSNPWFQKWLSHPSYDDYYQSMLPYGEDYKHINIPVLSITGYFDGAQISAIDFLQRHYLENPKANHSLLIGPYSHRTAQGTPQPFHSNYQLDTVALEKDTEEITFQWFDHVLFNQPKPKLIKDKINYQLMGSNTWQHSPSYKALNQQTKRFHLAENIAEKVMKKTFSLNHQNSLEKNTANVYRLSLKAPSTLESATLTVDFSDRKTQRHAQQWPLIQEQLNEPNGLIYITDAFEEKQQLAGAITGHFSIAINKRDVDIGFNLYEMSSTGKVMHLSRYISRASYAKDMSKRHLLTPNKKTLIPIINPRMTAKLIEKGSRLILVLNVNKNSGAEVNMGTGKTVSDETIADAGEPLIIHWFNDSLINIPLKPWRN